MRKAKSLDIQQYLNRIAWTDHVRVEPKALARLQYRHLLSVPFENLSIHENEPIILNNKSLFDKIVTRNRGGFCYEANGLFNALLNELGFKTSIISAQVARSDGTFTPLHDHMAIVVDLGDLWLVDVGFGDSFRFPLKIHQDEPHDEVGRSYQIDKNGDTFLVKQNLLNKGWEPQFKFTLQPFGYDDFHGMCNFHQESPESYFRKSRIVTLATDSGRITLSNLKFIETSLDGARKESVLESSEEYCKVLNERFGIVLERT